MPRLYIFAEGQTEQTFADTVLKKHLTAFGVYVQGPVLIAKSRKKGKVHRGGGSNYAAMKNDILRFLKQEKSRDVYFTTMIDLYALPGDFPGENESEKLQHSPYDRASKLEEHFAADINDPWGSPSRFIPHLQLHEYEAILLCSPAAFTVFFGDCQKQIERLAASIQNRPPELINDGEHTSPSKRILEQFPDYRGAKSTAGPLIAEKIGLKTVRNLCPHFDAWLKILESLHDRQS